jgi:hypothetical protein
MRHVVTAQRLSDGLVVFWRDGDWVEHIREATPLEQEALEEALAEGRADLAANLVVDVHSIDVDVRDGRPVPKRRRERLRALGPTVRFDLARPDDMEI